MFKIRSGGNLRAQQLSHPGCYGRSILSARQSPLGGKPHLSVVIPLELHHLQINAKIRRIQGTMRARADPTQLRELQLTLEALDLERSTGPADQKQCASSQKTRRSARFFRDRVRSLFRLPLGTLLVRSTHLPGTVDDSGDRIGEFEFLGKFIELGKQRETDLPTRGWPGRR